MPPGADRANTVPPGGVGDRADAVVDQDLDGTERAVRPGRSDAPLDGAVALGGDGSRQDKRAGRGEERGAHQREGRHGVVNR